MRIKNEAGVFGARRGIYNGSARIFTHRSKKTGKYWGEDIPVKTTTPFGTKIEYGDWVPGDKIKWLNN